jgi:hypothetical protein
MREAGHGAYLEPSGPCWTQAQIDARDKALAQAQADIEIEHGVASWRPRDAADGVDWSQAPRTGLKQALAEHAEAVRLRDAAGEVARRAAERVAACEDELKRFAGLDHEIEVERPARTSTLRLSSAETERACIPALNFTKL